MGVIRGSIRVKQQLKKAVQRVMRPCLQDTHAKIDAI
jgi:hypothetical protein